MNVYDFDKTIYAGDSTLDFYFFSLKKSPMLIRFLPIQIIGFIKYMFGMYSKLQFKEKFYSFLKGIKDVDSMVELFWNENQDKIKDWYLKSKEESDVIISASPEFLLNNICRRIGIKHLIASEVNKNTGICEGENCYGEEKVLRFKKYFEKGEIKKFYSDSLSDAPISLMASERYIVTGNNILPWDQYSPGKVKKLKNIFFTKEFFTFLIVGGINTINGIICIFFVFRCQCFFCTWICYGNDNFISFK